MNGTMAVQARNKMLMLGMILVTGRNSTVESDSTVRKVMAYSKKLRADPN